MTTVVYLPLDERPCNFKFPQQLANLTDIQLKTPELSILGNKKVPAQLEKVAGWLQEECKYADYLIVSIDMLVYGGIVPSRLHNHSEMQCLERLAVLKEIKRANPLIQIYAFNLIMRAPAYSSSEEEPDYYATYGEDLYTYGWLEDRMQSGVSTEEEKVKYHAILTTMPASIVNDFIGRRQINACINMATLQLIEEQMIDFLIVPLDDNSEYGFTAMEQRVLMRKVLQSRVADRIMIYPGADEIGCTLFARVFCRDKKFVPKLFIRYSSTKGPFVIPKYEDRTLHESIKCHVTASGASLSDSSADSDLIVIVNAAPVGQREMAETSDCLEQRHRSYFSEVGISEFVQSIRDYSERGHLVALADVAVCNGGDQVLMQQLSSAGLLEYLIAYAGWNTSGNTLGTVISHGVIETYYRSQGQALVEDNPIRVRNSRDYYYYRLIEDWGYQTIVRQDVWKHDLPKLQADYFRLSHVQEQVTAIIMSKLNCFIEQYLPQIKALGLQVSDVSMPWNRLFEIDFNMENVKGEEGMLSESE